MRDLYPHNRIALDNIYKLLKTDRLIALIQATGTGKTFVFMKLVEEKFKGKRVAYIVPKWAIKSNIESYEDFIEVRDQIDFYSYNYFKSSSKGDYLIGNYDLIVVDEVHHIASNIYGKNLYTTLQRASKKGVVCLGMTATPIIKRNNNNINVVDTFFKGKAVYGLSIQEGIERGLLPQVEYLICITDEKAILDSKTLRKLDLDASKSYLENIISQNPRRKWLAYFVSVAELENTQSIVRSILPGYKVFIIHSYMDNVYDTIKEFDSYKGNCVLLSVDMVLEGMHIDTVEGILLFRNVTSTVVFFQILGRLMSIGSKTVPLFIDIRNSVKNIRPIPELLEEEEKKIYKIQGERNIEPRSIFLATIDSVRQEKLLELIRRKLNIGTYVQGVYYPTKLNVCEHYGINLNTFSSWVSKNAKYLSFEEQILAYINIKKTYTIEGVEYKSKVEACRAYNVDFNLYCAWLRRYDKSSLPFTESLKLYIEDTKKGIIYNGKRYSSRHALTKDLGFDYSMFYQVCKRRPDWDINDVVNYIRKFDSEKIEYKYQGKVYTTKRELAQALGVAGSSISRTIRNNPDKPTNVVIDNFVKSIERRKSRYKVTIKEIDELCIKYGKERPYFQKVLRGHPDYTKEELEEHFLRNYFEFIYNRTLYKSKTALSRALGRSVGYLTHRAIKEGKTIEEVVYSMAIEISSMNRIYSYFGTSNTKEKVLEYLKYNPLQSLAFI